MPNDLDEERTRRIEQLLLRVVDASPGERPTVLAMVCSEAPEMADRLRRRVEELGALGMLVTDEEPAPTTRIGEYQVLDTIARGGMGIVYLGRHEPSGRLVALKCIRPEFADSERARERFRRETEAFGRVQHPGIAALYEAGMHERQPYLAMQLVTGEPLDAQLRRARALGIGSWSTSLAGAAAKPAPERDTAARSRDCLASVALIAELAAAVEALHAAGLVHRDLKPANVMVTPEGRPVLLDFGLAQDLLDESPALTLSQDAIGTPAYMAPEQVDRRGKSIDARTDVHALGALLYECLSLRTPFAGSSREDTYRRILTEDPIELRHLQPAASRDLAAVVHRALAKDPRRRFSTGAEFAEELRRVMRAEPTRTRPRGPLRRTVAWAGQRPTLVATIMTLVLALATGLIIVLQLLQHELAARRTHEAIEKTRSNPPAGAALAAEALDAGGGEPARSAVYAAMAEMRLVRSWPLGNTATAVAANADGSVLAASRYASPKEVTAWAGRREDVWSSVDFFRGDEHRYLVVLGRTRRLAVDDAADRLFVVGHLQESRLFDLHGDLVAVLPAHPEASMQQLETEPKPVDRRWHTIEGGMAQGIAYTVTRLGQVQCFDVRDGSLRRELCFVFPPEGDDEWVAAARDPNSGDHLFGSRAGNVVWTDRSGTVLRPSLQLEGPATFLAFRPDGGAAVAATGHRRQWTDIDPHEEPRRHVAIVFARDGDVQALHGHSDVVTGVSWSSDGGRVLTTSEDRTARIWNLGERHPDGTIPCTWLLHEKAVDHGLFLGDGERILTGSNSREATLWQRSGERLGDLRGHVSGCFAIAAVGDGERVLTASLDVRLLLWDTRPTWHWTAQCRSPIGAAIWDEDGGIWSAGITGAIEVWDPRRHGAVRTLDVADRLLKGERVWSSCWRGDDLVLGTSHGRLLLLATHADSVSVVELPITRAADEAGAPDPILRSRSHRDTIVANSIHGLQLLSDATGNSSSEWSDEAGAALVGFDIRPDGRVLAAGTTLSRVVFFDLGGGATQRHTEGLGSTVMDVAWAGPDFLVAATRDGMVFGLDDTGAEIWRTDLGTYCFLVRTSRDRRWIAVAAGDQRVRVLDCLGKQVLTLPPLRGRTRSIEFSPDSGSLLTASYEGSLCVWPLLLEETGTEIVARSPHRRVIGTAAGRR